MLRRPTIWLVGLIGAIWAQPVVAQPRLDWIVEVEVQRLAADPALEGVRSQVPWLMAQGPQGQTIQRMTIAGQLPPRGDAGDLGLAGRDPIRLLDSIIIRLQWSQPPGELPEILGLPVQQRRQLDGRTVWDLQGFMPLAEVQGEFVEIKTGKFLGGNLTEFLSPELATAWQQLPAQTLLKAQVVIPQRLKTADTVANRRVPRKPRFWESPSFYDWLDHGSIVAGAANGPLLSLTLEGHDEDTTRRLAEFLQVYLSAVQTRLTAGQEPPWGQLTKPQQQSLFTWVRQWTLHRQGQQASLEVETPPVLNRDIFQALMETVVEVASGVTDRITYQGWMELEAEALDGFQRVRVFGRSNLPEGTRLQVRMTAAPEVTQLLMLSGAGSAIVNPDPAEAIVQADGTLEAIIPVPRGVKTGNYRVQAWGDSREQPPAVVQQLGINMRKLEGPLKGQQGQGGIEYDLPSVALRKKLSLAERRSEKRKMQQFAKQLEGDFQQLQRLTQQGIWQASRFSERQTVLGPWQAGVEQLRQQVIQQLADPEAIAAVQLACRQLVAIHAAYSQIPTGGFNITPQLVQDRIDQAQATERQFEQQLKSLENYIGNY